MASITAMRAALETNVKTVSGLRCYDRFPDNPEPPCATIFLGDPAIQRLSMRKGWFEYRFVVSVLIALADAEYAQTKLDGYLTTSGSTSVWTAIESDRTLAGSAADCSVEQVRGYIGTYIVGTVPYFAAEFDVMALGAG